MKGCLGFVLLFFVVTLAPANEPSGSEAKGKENVFKKGGKAFVQDMKDLGKGIKNSRTGQAVVEGSKEVGHETAEVSKKGWNKTKKVSLEAWDGVQRATRAFWEDLLEAKRRTAAKLRSENESLRSKKESG